MTLSNALWVVRSGNPLGLTQPQGRCSKAAADSRETQGNKGTLGLKELNSNRQGSCFLWLWGPPVLPPVASRLQLSACSSLLSRKTLSFAHSLLYTRCSYLLCGLHDVFRLLCFSLPGPKGTLIVRLERGPCLVDRVTNLYLLGL